MNFSVIIPVYNRKIMVLKAIESVLNQSYLPLEIIVVDDGSTDGINNLTWDPLVKYIRINHCGFPGHVRNSGALIAQGDFLAFLDSDDVWDKDKLMFQKQFLENNPEFVFVHTKERWLMNNNLVSQRKRKHKREGYIFEDCLKSCILGPSTSVIKKDVFWELGGFDPKIEVGEDYDLWLKLSNKYPIGYIDKELIIKNAGHPNQLSFKYPYIESIRINILENLISKNIFSSINQNLALTELKNKYNIVIGGLEKKGLIQEANNLRNKLI